MTCSLVITTYNWKKALELVLLSVLKQSLLPDEIIIADDGSTNDTKELIEHFKNTSKLKIIHSWQEDDGFRASASRNRAIAKASSEYIILIDGDMILHNDFIKDHLFHAKRNHFIQGSRILLTQNKSQSVFQKKSIKFSLFEKGLQNRKNRIKCSLLTKILSTPNSNLKGIKTCNMSFFKEDCLKVNGFNEDFVGWGREDSEFVVRLINNNILRINIKFAAIAYHIFHNENSREMLSVNDEILDKAIKHNVLVCDNGINKYLKERV